MRWLGHLLAFFGFDKITSGVVVKKTDYVAGISEVMHPIAVGKTVVVTEDTISAIRSLSVSVRGLDRHGALVTQEIYVDGLTYSTTEVGDSWPQEEAHGK